MRALAAPHGSMALDGRTDGESLRLGAEYMHRVSSPLSLYSEAWVELHRKAGLKYQVAAGARYEW